MNGLQLALNEQQRLAVGHLGGPLRVLAVAGSGKTLVLTQRIVHLVEEQKVDPGNILAITFARKAAQEIKTRLKASLDGRSERITSGTFHSVCYRILRRAAYPTARFAVLDEDASLEILEEASTKAKVGMDLVELSRAISLSKAELMSPVDLAKSEDPHLQMVAEVYDCYERLKRRKGALDFDDLIYNCYLLLSEDKNTLARYRAIYRHILVDEFQDSCRGMVELVKLLGEPDNNLWLAGDDDQCIHAFRGARSDYFIDLEDHYHEALVTVEMSTNYRSTKAIIGVANRLISHNTTRVEKIMTTANPDGDPVELLKANDQGHEGQLVVEKLLALKEAGYASKDIAILGRCHHQLPVIESALLLNGIPYTTPGGLILFDQPVLRAVLSTAALLAKGETPAALDPQKLARLSAVHLGETESPLPHQSAPDELLQTARLIHQERRQKESDPEQRTLTAAYFSALQSMASLFSGFDEFLTYIEKTRELIRQAGKDKVTLSTIHQAKGLEFPAVFVIGVEEGTLPHHNSLEKGGADIEEERRLMYVAVTRAMKKLFVSHCVKRGGKEVMPSRFIFEMSP